MSRSTPRMNEAETIAELIETRGSSHGDAVAQMSTAGALWGRYLVALGWTPPTGRTHEIAASQADLMMVLLKVSRAAHGNPAFDDHYDDINGYADLAKDAAKRGN